MTHGPGPVGGPGHAGTWPQPLGPDVDQAVPVASAGQQVILDKETVAQDGWEAALLHDEEVCQVDAVAQGDGDTNQELPGLHSDSLIIQADPDGLDVVELCTNLL